MNKLPIILGAVGAAGLAGEAAAARTIPFEGIFNRLSAKYGVPKRLAVAIVSWESNFDPQAVNGEAAADARLGRDVDSVGLGQVLWPDTADIYGVSRAELFDPETNLDVMYRVLRGKLKRYPAPAGSFPEDAVSAYNAGSSLRTTGGAFVNQAYVNGVRGEWEAFSNA